MPPRRSIGDMMDLPLDSSPIQVPSVQTGGLPGSGTTPEGSPHSSLSSPRPRPSLSLGSPDTPSPPERVAERRKRSAQDMTQFADETARVQKLVKVDHDGLRAFSKLDCSEQLITLAGHMLKLQRTMGAIQPAEAIFVIPTKLKKKIDDHTCILLMDSSLAAYRNDNLGAPKLLLDLIEDNPAWGYTSEMKDDSSKVEAVDSYMGRALTQGRNVLKSTIKKSLGSDPNDAAVSLRPGALDIVALTQLLLKQFKFKKNGRVTIDIPLCGRIALLRQLITEKDDSTYWTEVDTHLANLRTKYPDKKLYSKFIKRRVLDTDFESYGQVSLDDLNGGAATINPVFTPAPRRNAVASGSGSAPSS
ncbi:hypothetical protein B0H10DRAFT_2019885 [Mycena sp. CBHHK59/15]|nr:hypothetical protein B0H10DRAFT_2019885 [Mycena sp. CBHHK59/15]